jgi:hypothetical protein
MSEWCEREDHLDPTNIERCPRCGSTAFHIQESLMVTEYCDRVHFIDALECFKCDAKISLDLLLRLLTVEAELGKYLELGKEISKK